MKKITRIECQIKRKGRYNVYLDDQFALGIDEDTLIAHRLSVGMEVSDTFWSEVIESETMNKGLNYAINLLSYRVRSEHEIVQKMKQKGYEEKVIEFTLDKLREYGYVDDYRFATQWVVSKQKEKLAGKSLLRQELYQKGVSRDIIDQVLSENIQEDEEVERAREILEKKWRSVASEDWASQYRKLSGMLGRKGYAYSIISEVVKAFMKEMREGA